MTERQSLSSEIVNEPATISDLRQIRQGSSKDIETVYEGDVAVRSRFHFSDRVSVFDLGPIPGDFPGIGRPRCSIAGEIFRRMNAADFVTHYLSHDVEKRTMDVLLLDIPDKNINSGPRSVGRILGLELLDRRDLNERVVTRIDSEELDIARIEKLLQGPLCVGTALNPPFVECTTKYEEADRYISDEEAATLGHNKLTLVRVESIYGEVRRFSDFLANLLRSAGFIRPDGKSEGAIRYSDGTFIFVDSNSPDEMRLIGADGLHYDKDPIREWFEIHHPGWCRALRAVKKAYPNDKTKWPQYSDLDSLPPDSFRQEMVGRYNTVDKALRSLTF